MDHIKPQTRSEKYVRQGVEYTAWRAMLTRCYDSRYEMFHRYGGRGIAVCERWRESFDAFVDDMGRRPDGKYSLDRIDVDGNYEPTNCRWTTYGVQMRNKSDNHRLEFRGEEMTMTDWSERLGIPQSTIRARLRYGWSIERALTEPIDEQKTLAKRGNSRGVVLTANDVVEIRRLLATDMKHREIAARFGVSKITIDYISQGKTWRHVA